MKTDEYIDAVVSLLLEHTKAKNLIDLVSALGGSIEQTDNWAHMEIVNDFNFIIFVNPVYDYNVYINEYMQIAHELGHLFLHKNSSNTIYYDFGGGVENREAWYFGNNLLKKIKKGVLSWEEVQTEELQLEMYKEKNNYKIKQNLNYQKIITK